MIRLVIHINIRFLLTFLLTTNLCGQEKNVIRLFFAGDIMCHNTQLISAYDTITNQYDFSSYFANVQRLLQSADMAFANFETTLPGMNYTGYPQFGSPDILATQLKESGFDCLFTANNHSLDKGISGVERTIRFFNQAEILHTGTFTSKEEKELLNPLIIKIKNFRIALLNYTYGLNSSMNTPRYLVNQIDTVSMKNAINRSKDLKVDFTVCYLHWGEEYSVVPIDGQIELSQWLHDQGVSLVVGSHPHVVQLVECVESGDFIESLTAYSLGNLISNQRKGQRKQGLILEVILSPVSGNLEIVDFIEHPTYVIRNPIDQNGRFKYEITLPALPAPTSQTAGL